MKTRPLADPLLRRFFPDWDHYRSHAQRWSTQLLGGAPNGGCVLSVLATGGGKTLTYVLPMLDERRLRGRACTLVVVPTISLMADQANALNRHYSPIGQPIRAAASNSTISFERRRLIEDGFMAGDLDVLLVSPERAMNLEFAEKLASMGANLPFLVVDEVHLVSDWGEGFRPDFQRLGWLRKRLVRSNPALRTQLLSATVTPRTETEIRRVFDVPDELWRTARGSSMRFEAQIAIEPLADPTRTSSAEWLRANVRSLETPALIYVTRPDDANELRDMLREMGLVAAAYHGKTLNAERERVLRGWHDGSITHVVGTSAFGLGIDKPNVRTVVHLCIPETLDRLYQEIGRGGRDGAPCLATVVTVSEDVAIARATAKKLLREKTARPRWDKHMVSGGTLLGQSDEGVFWLVDEFAIPDYWERPWFIQKQSAKVAQHTNWNKSLVNFFERCGFVKYEGPVIAEVQGFGTKSTFPLLQSLGAVATQGTEYHPDALSVKLPGLPGVNWRERRDHMLSVANTMTEPRWQWRSVVRINDLEAVDPDEAVRERFWKRVEVARQAELQHSYRTIDEAAKYMRNPPPECLRRAFARIYNETLESCGNCSQCQAQGLQRGAAQEFMAPSAWPARPETAPQALWGSTATLAIGDVDDREPELGVLRTAGFRQFVIPEAWSNPDLEGTTHYCEELDVGSALLDNVPTVALLPADIDSEVAKRVVAVFRLRAATFSKDVPLLMVVSEGANWSGKDEWQDRFDGRVLGYRQLLEEFSKESNQ